MSLPKANISFVIPSTHDDLELDCRLYYPRRTDGNVQSLGRAFAILAHPYAPLGGSYDDPVVGLAGSVLLQYGCILATFNFRGASGSAGRTSWSGKAELADYVSVYGFMLCYIDALYRSQEGEGGCSDVSGRASTPPPLLVLGGYSYGAMVASHLPSIEVVADLFESPTAGSAESEIKLRALDLSRDANAYLTVHNSSSTTLSPSGTGSGQRQQGQSPGRAVTAGGYESDAASRRVSRESSRRSVDGERFRQSMDKVRQKFRSRGQAGHIIASQSEREPELAEKVLLRPSVAYVLISPLLPPIAGFMTMFSTLRFTPKGRRTGPSPEEYHELTVHPCCCLFGSKDVFTTDAKLQRWAQDLRSRSRSQFTIVRVDTGHFWRERAALEQLRQGLREWLRTLTPNHEDGNQQL
ncbi:hypothetical protein HRR81_002537 [Exophiala dermatitidis]|nr:hypothetical protein HRR81_002537 [Exophiala dermatitidis]